MRIVSDQLSSLETLPPQHFAQFRSYLGTSSGSQSAQFRAIEAASGLRERALHAGARRSTARFPKWFSAPSIGRRFRSCFSSCWTPSGVKIDDLYLGPGPTVLFFLAEALLEYEQLFGQWRFNHVQLVERVIGPSTGGTGGTLGSRYLMKTIDQRFFPALWAVRTKLFGS